MPSQPLNKRQNVTESQATKVPALPLTAKGRGLPEQTGCLTPSAMIMTPMALPHQLPPPTIAELPQHLIGIELVCPEKKMWSQAGAGRTRPSRVGSTRR